LLFAILVPLSYCQTVTRLFLTVLELSFEFGKVSGLPIAGIGLHIAYPVIVVTRIGSNSGLRSF
jgi:hypothetical protein